ncbi:MAG: PAS domain S-box protein [Bacteroidales bacterium]|nr:PAS domain S-box protein [Bacteroidales bacterium]
MLTKLTPKTEKQLLLENEELRASLAEANETLDAIRNGEVDAIVVSGAGGEKVFSISSAETPYRVIIEEMNEGAVVLSADGVVLYCNRRFAELVSVAPEQIVGSWFKQFFPKNDFQKYNELLQAGLKGKTDGELTYIKDGNAHPIHLHLSFSPLPPELLGDVCIMAADITELKQKEEELRRSHETLEQQVIERTKELTEAVEELANKQRVALKMMNDAVEAKNTLDILNKELALQNEEKAKRAAELIIANKELAFQNEEKEERAAELEIANKELAFQNEEKEKRAVELLVAKEKAEEFENKFRQIAENIDEVFWLRTNSEMIYVSPSFEKIWGVPCQSLYEDPDLFTEKIHPEDKSLVKKIFNSNEFNDKEFFNYEYRIVRADKQVRWVNAKTFPILDDSGQIVKRVGIASDITEKHLSIEELIKEKEHAEESDRLKSAFLANMSHEIRTPMNGIIGFADLLKEPHLTDEQQQDYIKTIEMSGIRMLNIINNIVDISKIEAGLMEANRTILDVNEQLEYVFTFFKPETNKKKLQLVLGKNLSATDAIITSDREKIYAILTNLVKNAIKYTNEGVIEIGCDKKGEMLEFYVKDTGIGIPADRQVAVFERFIQADIADIHAFQGAGLGLSIAKAYTELLGGRIWLESEEGKGSTFFFLIPYSPFSKDKPADLKPVAGAEKLNTSGNLKIVIAEDDETSQMLMSIVVKPYCKEIIRASTGAATIEICQKNQDIDLVLMDIQMPDINGYEATRQIRKFNKNVVIIAQTAFGLSGDRGKAIEAGCNDYIAKPVKKEELIAVIENHINKKANCILL